MWFEMGASARILLLVDENMRDIDNAIIIISSTWVLSNNDGDDDQ